MRPAAWGDLRTRPRRQFPVHADRQFRPDYQTTCVPARGQENRRDNAEWTSASTRERSALRSLPRSAAGCPATLRDLDGNQSRRLVAKPADFALDALDYPVQGWESKQSKPKRCRIPGARRTPERRPDARDRWHAGHRTVAQGSPGRAAGARTRRRRNEPEFVAGCFNRTCRPHGGAAQDHQTGVSAPGAAVLTPGLRPGTPELGWSMNVPNRTIIRG
jgi:hypothetical protein